MAKPRKPAPTPPGEPHGKVALEEFREDVLSLLKRGFSEHQIARALGRSRDAVHRASIQVRPRMRQALEESAEDIYAAATAELEEVRSELWVNYGRVLPPRSLPDGTTPKDENSGLRLAYLQAIASLPAKRVEIGQRLGLVAEAPQRVEIIQRVQRSIADAMMELSPEEAERLGAKFAEAVRTR